MTERPSKDQYYLDIAKEVSRRSTCHRNAFGALIIRYDQMIASGYVGAPRGTKDCFEHGFCLRDKLEIPHGQRYELCRSVHAEMNAIINSARAGVSLLGGDMYIYGERKPNGEKVDAIPCFICKKMVINAGIRRVISSTKDGGINIFEVANWTMDWQEHDIIDDKQQYGTDQNKK